MSPVPPALPPLARSPRRWARALPCALVTATLLGSCPLLAQQPYDIALRDGLLSIRANDAPMTELAAALAAATGVNFIVTGDAGAPITTEIVDEPFAKAVAKLSPNHLLVKDGKSADAAVIEVVLILDESSDAGGGGDGFLPSGAPADEIVGDEGVPPIDDQGQQFEQMQQLEQSDGQIYAPDGSIQDGVQDGMAIPDDGLAPEGELPLAQ